MSAVVFLGPSLSAAAAHRRLDACYLPPARCGDLYRAARDRAPTAILLIDGRFHDTPAVWHREILWALGRGIHVFGAASMGALRAAELEPFGMRGIGRVAEAYRSGRFDPFADRFDDDGEVAVAHAPPELGSAPLSVALVDVRHAVAAAAARGLISAARRDALVAAAAGLFYADRTPDRLRELIDAQLAPGPALDAVLDGVLDRDTTLKATDAAHALDALAAFLRTRPAPFRPAFALEPTLAWERFRRAADASVAALAPAAELALDELRLDPPAWSMLERRAARRVAGSRRASGDDGPPDAATRRRALAALRARHGLDDRAALDAWLRREGLDLAALDARLDDEAALLAIAERERPAIERAMLDLLREDGRLAALEARARARTPLAPPRSAPGRAARETALLAWFAARHPDFTDSGGDAASLARRLGCRDEAHLFAVLARGFAAGAEDVPR